MRSPDVVGNHFTNMDMTFLPFRGARVSRKTWFVLTTKTESGGANWGANRPVGFAGHISKCPGARQRVARRLGGAGTLVSGRRMRIGRKQWASPGSPPQAVR